MRGATVAVRIGMGVLGAVYAWWGVWARFWPVQFFTTFPGLGHRWTAAYPPYNEHLVTDLGATFLTLAFFLFVGAASQASVRTVVLFGVGIFNALHLSFHILDHGTLRGLDMTESLASLTLGLVIPAVLLTFDRVGTAERVRPAVSAGKAEESTA